MLVILWIVGALVAIVVLAMLLVPMFIDRAGTARYGAGAGAGPDRR
jgi:hypothetical protein